MMSKYNGDWLREWLCDTKKVAVRLLHMIYSKCFFFNFCECACGICSMMSKYSGDRKVMREWLCDKKKVAIRLLHMIYSKCCFLKILRVCVRYLQHDV